MKYYYELFPGEETKAGVNLRICRHDRTTGEIDTVVILVPFDRINDEMITPEGPYGLNLMFLGSHYE